MAITEQNLVVAEINNYPEAKFNRLFPCTLTQLSPLHKVMVNIVQIDPTSKSDVYDQKDGGKSLTKISCLKLMTAANVVMEESKKILPATCQRCVEVARMTTKAPQCGGCPNKDDVAYQVSILVPEPSGGYRRYVATKEVSKEQHLAKKNPLEHMAAQCETKALLRALRAGLGIKGSYTVGELKKPFAVALVVLNTTDPELKKALIQRYAAGKDALFGAPQAMQLSAGDTHALPDGRVVDTDTGEVTTEVIPDNDEDEAPNYDDPPAFDDDAVTCEVCDEIVEEWTDKKGKVWTVEEWVEYTQKNLGKIHCCTCAEKEIRARMAAKKGA